MQLVILGRQPELSLAELASVTGREPQVVGPHAASTDFNLDINHLGGSLKIGEILGQTSTADTEGPAATLAKLIKQTHNSTKLTFGLSCYDTKFSPRQVNQVGLMVKRLLKDDYDHIRFVPAKTTSLNAAQVTNNGLAKDGLELLIAQTKAGLVIARTNQVQDVDAYSKRDYGRPCRNPKVGMLPPKLAQIMLNLAKPAANSLIVDPFCGVGTIPQEALLLGYNALGSDIDSGILDCARENLEWLTGEFRPAGHFELKLADATKGSLPESIGAVVTEGYLGPPLEKEPNQDELPDLLEATGNLNLGFLQNLSSQLRTGVKICMCLPAWQVGQDLKRLPIIDQITSLGYNMERLTAHRRPLIYKRPSQIVAREIIILRKV